MEQSLKSTLEDKKFEALLPIAMACAAEPLGFAF